MNLKKLMIVAVMLLLTVPTMALTPWKKGAFETGKYRNLFVEMGYKQADVDAKLKEVFNDVFRASARVTSRGVVGRTVPVTPQVQPATASCISSRHSSLPPTVGAMIPASITRLRPSASSMPSSRRNTSLNSAVALAALAVSGADSSSRVHRRCTSSTPRRNSSPSHQMVSDSVIPTPPIISLPSTRSGQSGVTTDVPTSGKSAPRRVVSSCIRLPTRRRV